MFVNTIFRRIIFIIIFSVASFIFISILFSPIYNANSVILPFNFNPIDICQEHPVFWNKFKQLYLLFHILANLIYSNLIYSIFFRKQKSNSSNTSLQPSSNQLSLFIGNTSDNTSIYLPESSLYQNFLITGTIRNRKNKLCYLSFHSTINKISSSII